MCGFPLLASTVGTPLWVGPVGLALLGRTSSLLVRAHAWRDRGAGRGAGSTAGGRLGTASGARACGCSWRGARGRRVFLVEAHDRRVEVVSVLRGCRCAVGYYH